MHRELIDQARVDGYDAFCVGALIVRHGRLLMLRRAASDSWAGRWEPPGGGVETGESLAEALAREVQEEAGLAIASALYIGHLDYPARENPSRQQGVLLRGRGSARSLASPDQPDRTRSLRLVQV
ncbi:NUDIX hydrolase [Kitasatospora sp. NPDC101157]|uniref:NUDIX hydrolase n=1 Tax=Kitasatospora sp. NPDC101157 TaxID=3364098 RepID=UPI00380E87BA